MVLGIASRVRAPCEDGAARICFPYALVSCHLVATLMKRVFKLLLMLLALPPIALVAIVLASLESEPLVASRLKLTADEVEQAKALVKEHDPRTAAEGEVRSISLNESELNLIGNYLAHAKGGGAEVTVTEGLMDVKATVKVPKSPLGQYLNMSVGFRESEVLPRFRQIRLGSIPVPAWFADFILEKTLNYFYSQPGYSFAQDVVREVNLSPSQLDVTYEWSSQITDAVRSRFVTKADQKRIKIFQEKLSRELSRGGFGNKTSVTNIVAPLFALARKRASEGDPIADNRAVILVLAVYVNGKDVAKLAPDVGELAAVVKVKTTLQKRHDLSKHFFTSAALAVQGGSVLSEAIGIYKEVGDSRWGSGFSFADLQAGHAGARFGEVAIASKSSAKALQNQLAEGLTEAILLPSVAGMPDGLTEAEFKSTYGEVGSNAYNVVVAEISKRIASSPLYQ